MNIDKTIFEFDSDVYSREEVSKFSRRTCERLAHLDDENVCKYDLIDGGATLEELLNNGFFDNGCACFRVFI